MNYAVEQRMVMIDFLLAHYGSVGRIELADYFGIAPSQVTRDFVQYNELAPGNARLVSKRWIRTENFKRLYA